MNNVHELDQTLSTLLAQLAPQARGAFMRQVAKELRRRQQKHIQAQQNPDGSPFVPRKKKRRDKQGRIKRKMFTKLRTARYIKNESNADEAAVA
ncbi:phage virion morphogenesis protein, partial [Yersinia pseudotuberculosis]